MEVIKWLFSKQIKDINDCLDCKHCKEFHKYAIYYCDKAVRKGHYVLFSGLIMYYDDCSNRFRAKECKNKNDNFLSFVEKLRIIIHGDWKYYNENIG